MELKDILSELDNPTTLSTAPVNNNLSLTIEDLNKIIESIPTPNVVSIKHNGCENFFKAFVNRSLNGKAMRANGLAELYGLPVREDLHVPFGQICLYDINDRVVERFVWGGASSFLPKNDVLIKLSK